MSVGATPVDLLAGTAHVHSAVNLIVGAVALLVVIVSPTATILILSTRSTRRKLARVAAAHPSARAWIVNERRASHVLLIDDDAVSLVTLKDQAEYTWPRSQLSSAVVVDKVRVAIPARPGLRLDFSDGSSFATTTFTFPVRGGFWSSREAAESVRSMLVPSNG